MRGLKTIWAGATYPLRRWPRLSKAAVSGAFLIVLVVAGSNAYILLSTQGESTDVVADVPHAQVAIVPGALVQPNGKMSVMLGDRVKQAAKLWRAGTGAQGDDAARRPAARRLRGSRRLRHLGHDGAGPGHLRRARRRRRHAGIPHAAGAFSRRRGRHPRNRPYFGPAPLRLPAEEERSARGALAGQGDRRRDARYAGDGRSLDPDLQHRRPRKLGPGAAARCATRRLARSLAAVVESVDVEALVGGPVGVPVAAFMPARP